MPWLRHQRRSINNIRVLSEIRSTSAADFTDTKQQSRCEPKQQTQTQQQKPPREAISKGCRETKQRVSETKGPLECDIFENITLFRRHRDREEKYGEDSEKKSAQHEGSEINGSVANASHFH